MHIQRGEQSLVSEYHRVIWCPYIPDDADDSSATDSTTQDNASRVLVLTNDEKVCVAPTQSSYNVVLWFLELV